MSVNLWTGTPTAAVDNGTNGTTGLTLGVKFVCNVAGNITHLRYYEQSNTRGTITLRLIGSNSTVIDTVTHTATVGLSGWREIALSAPYSAGAGTKVMVTCYIPAASMNYDYNYGTLNSQLLSSIYSTSGSEYSTIDDGAETIAGSTGNGVYTYSNVTTTIPTNTFNSSNYALDFNYELGTNSSTNSAGAAADLGNGTGSWGSPSNAIGDPNNSWASWYA